MTLPDADPLLIAHRAGNALPLVARALSAGADMIEADVWLHRSRLEVRHLKTLGRVPVLWDRWKLQPAWVPRLQLKELLRAAAPETRVMLDLKGRAEGLTPAILALLESEAPSGLNGPGRQLTLCARGWDHLEVLREFPRVGVVHSVGTPEQLRVVTRRLGWRHDHALSVHERLLTRPVVEDLLQAVPLIMAWPVNTRRRYGELHALGVRGFIIDDLDLLATLARERAGAVQSPEWSGDAGA